MCDRMGLAARRGRRESSRPCLGVDEKVLNHVSTNVSTISRPPRTRLNQFLNHPKCLNLVSTLSQPCLNHVSTLSQPCLNLVSTNFSTTRMSQPCLNHVSTLSQPISQPPKCLNLVSTLSQPCPNLVSTKVSTTSWSQSRLDLVSTSSQPISQPCSQQAHRMKNESLNKPIV